MTDTGMGFGFGGSADDGISLNMGLETTGGLGGYTPLPDGTHRFVVIEPPEVSTTNAGEMMLSLKLKVEHSNADGAMGLTHNERIVIPGAERAANEPDKWQTMMKMLRMKLEAITGQPWRDDNLKLRPRELSGCSFVATSKQKAPREYTKDDGSTGTATDVELNNWQSIAGASSANPMQDQLAAANAAAGVPGSPTQAAAPAGSGGFQL